MRIYRNRIACYLLICSVAYGQLPYHALKLIAYPYESVKDAFQKLCRAGLLETIKMPRSKSFAVTDLGYEAYCKAMHIDAYEAEELPSKPISVRNPHKALRLSRVNEAAMFFAFSVCQKYRTSLEIKRQMEDRAVRSADNLKYSRFVGCLDTAATSYLVYHFGRGNQRLNPNGEKNAAAIFARDGVWCPKIVLVDTPEAAANILLYSLWALKKDPSVLRHMQLNFRITYDENAVLLPISQQSERFAKILDRPNGHRTLSRMEDRFQDTVRPICLLHGRWAELLYCIAKCENSSAEIKVVLWDFQLPILQALYAREQMPCHINAVCLHMDDFEVYAVPYKSVFQPTILQYDFL